MSKYKISDYDIDTDKEALVWIANELAESNRLRRVAIHLKIIEMVDPAQVVDFQFKADEDLA